MTTWTYKAIDASGRKVRGVMDAANPSDLENRLLHLGLELIRAKPRARFSRPAPLSRRDLITLCFHLEQLSRAGIPLKDALSDLSDALPPGRLRDAVAGLTESISGGRTLSAAMEEQAGVFPEVVRNLIRAGETAGQLPSICQQLSEALKHDDELAHAAQRLALYPAIMLLVILGALSVSLLYLVPQLAGLFSSLGQQLPLHTRVLIAASRFATQHGLALLITSVALIIAARLHIARSARAARRFDRLLLSLPALGGVLKKILLARFTRTFALLYGAGIPIIDCLRTTRGTSRNTLLREAIDEAIASIEHGINLSSAFAQSGLFPPLVIRMLRVGETTGELSAALGNVNYFFDRDASEGLARAQALLQPLLTLLMGAMLAWVMLSVLGPVYDILARVKP